MGVADPAVWGRPIPALIPGPTSLVRGIMKPWHGPPDRSVKHTCTVVAEVAAKQNDNQPEDDDRLHSGCISPSIHGRNEGANPAYGDSPVISVTHQKSHSAAVSVMSHQTSRGDQPCTPE
jgi:hypothetical protein